MDVSFPFTDEVWSHKKPSPAEFSSDGGITAKVTLPNFMGNVRYVEQVLVLSFNKCSKSWIHTGKRFKAGSQLWKAF